MSLTCVGGDPGSVGHTMHSNRSSGVVFESPVFCGFLAIFGTVEAGAIKKKLCHESRCLKQVIFPV